jgi:hypothetical protein
MFRQEIRGNILMAAANENNWLKNCCTEIVKNMIEILHTISKSKRAPV